jgi:molybdopterin-guanine dinucleotide biosynthesis protein A
MTAAATPAPAPPAAEFDAIVLAGGRAARLGGADKPGLMVAGQSMLNSVITAVAAAGARAIIVVGPARPDAGSPPASGLSAAPPGGVSFVLEQPAGAGPVPALRRGLAEARGPVLALLAADLPFLRAAPIRLLLAAVGPGRAGAVLVDDAGRPQWLVSCWLAPALRTAAAAYRGASLHGLLRPLRPALIGYRPRAGEAPPWFDCDTADELSLARNWAAGGPPARSPADTTPEAHR